MPGIDPPLVAQLRPLSHAVLRERLHRLRTVGTAGDAHATATAEEILANADSDAIRDATAKRAVSRHPPCDVADADALLPKRALLAELARAYESAPDSRRFQRCEGQPLPAALLAALLVTLRR